MPKNIGELIEMNGYRADSLNETGPAPANPISRGILSDNDHQTTADLRLIRRAVRNGWNIPPEMKERLRERMDAVLKQSDDARCSVAAAKVILDADQADQRFQLATEAAEKAPTTQVNVQVNQYGATSEQGRLSEALAILDAARARQGIAAPVPASDELHSPQADTAPSAIPGTGTT